MHISAVHLNKTIQSRTQAIHLHSSGVHLGKAIRLNTKWFTCTEVLCIYLGKTVQSKADHVTVTPKLIELAVVQ